MIHRIELTQAAKFARKRGKIMADQQPEQVVRGIQLRCEPAWGAYATMVAKNLGISMSRLIERSIVAYAKAKGIRAKAPDRTKY